MLMEEPGALPPCKKKRVRTASGTQAMAPVFSGDTKVFAAGLHFTQARKLVSSGGIRVGKLHVVPFLLLCDRLHGVCLGLAYLAKQMSACGRSGAFWQPFRTVRLISAPVVAQLLLGSAGLGAWAARTEQSRFPRLTPGW